MWVSFWVFCSVLLICTSVFCASTVLSWWQKLCNLEIWNCDISSFVFLFQDCFGYLGNFLVLFLVVLIIVLTGVRRYVIVVLIFISLMIIDVEPFFLCLLTIWIASLKRYLFMPSTLFLVGLTVCMFVDTEFCEFFMYFSD